MFPLGDDNSARRSLPIVTWTLIVLNVLVYFLFQGAGANLAFTYAFSVIPFEITHFTDLVGNMQMAGGELELFKGPTPIWLTIFSAMFMHGGLAHLGGNMLYLWIFGDNVEDNMGKFKFLIFYVLCGIVATFAQIVSAPSSTIPNLGASGAIAGALGAYLVMFPQNSIRVLAFYQIIPLPALIVVGMWGAMQMLSGFGSLANAGDAGGVAYMAHVGGFVCGMILCLLFRNKSLSLREQKQTYRDQFSHLNEQRRFR